MVTEKMLNRSFIRTYVIVTLKHDQCWLLTHASYSFMLVLQKKKKTRFCLWLELTFSLYAHLLDPLGVPMPWVSDCVGGTLNIERNDLKRRNLAGRFTMIYAALCCVNYGSYVGGGRMIPNVAPWICTLRLMDTKQANTDFCVYMLNQ